jgi:hypothetical protein
MTIQSSALFIRRYPMKRCMLWSVLLMVVLSLTTVFAENKNEEKGGKLKGEKIVMIIAERMFESS